MIDQLIAHEELLNAVSLLEIAIDEIAKSRRYLEASLGNLHELRESLE